MYTNPFIHSIDDINLVDEELFTEFTELAISDIDEDIKYNYCPDCKTPMEQSVSEYQCTNCSLTLKNEGYDNYKNHEDTVSTSIRITTGVNSGRNYHLNSDYTRTQRKMIYEQLRRYALAYSGPAFPQDVLNATANQYNLIQKSVTEDEYNEQGDIHKKKFVRRGNIKDEVLAALIYFECIRVGIVRKKRDIATFMKLTLKGFSRGEDIVRNLQAENHIDIPVNVEPIEGFIDRYLEALEIENPNYVNFIKDIVTESERLKIGMSSHISSKIVGAIWIIIEKCKLNITDKQLELAADDTKKNTFTLFSKIVLKNISVFGPIFIKYNIPR